MSSAGRDKKKSKKKPAEDKAAAAQPNASVGVTSGVGIAATWILVFERNEQCDEADRLDDKQISDFMKSEFPDLDAVTFDRVEIARGRYNRGGFHKKDKSGKVVPPKIRSAQHGASDTSAGGRHSSPQPGATQIPDRVVSHKKDFKSHKK